MNLEAVQVREAKNAFGGVWRAHEMRQLRVELGMFEEGRSNAEAAISKKEMGHLKLPEMQSGSQRSEVGGSSDGGGGGGASCGANMESVERSRE